MLPWLFLLIGYEMRGYEKELEPSLANVFQSTFSSTYILPSPFFHDMHVF